MGNGLVLKFKGNKSFVAFSNLGEAEALTKTWRVCAKVAAHLEQGQRLENLSWRLWHIQSLMLESDNAKTKREFRKLSKTMGEKLDKEKGKSIEELTAPKFQRTESSDRICRLALEKERQRESLANARDGGRLNRMQFTFSVDPSNPNAHPGANANPNANANPTSASGSGSPLGRRPGSKKKGKDRAAVQDKDKDKDGYTSSGFESDASSVALASRSRSFRAGAGAGAYSRANNSHSHLSELAMADDADADMNADMDVYPNPKMATTPTASSMQGMSMMAVGTGNGGGYTPQTQRHAGLMNHNHNHNDMAANSNGDTTQYDPNFASNESSSNNNANANNTNDATSPNALRFPTLFTSDFTPSALLYTPSSAADYASTGRPSLSYGEGGDADGRRGRDSFGVSRPTIEVPLDELMGMNMNMNANGNMMGLGVDMSQWRPYGDQASTHGQQQGNNLTIPDTAYNAMASGNANGNVNGNGNTNDGLEIKEEDVVMYGPHPNPNHMPIDPNPNPNAHPANASAVGAPVSTSTTTSASASFSASAAEYDSAMAQMQNLGVGAYGPMIGPPMGPYGVGHEIDRAKTPQQGTMKPGAANPSAVPAPAPASSSAVSTPQTSITNANTNVNTNANAGNASTNTKAKANGKEKEKQPSLSINTKNLGNSNTTGTGTVGRGRRANSTASASTGATRESSRVSASVPRSATAATASTASNAGTHAQHSHSSSAGSVTAPASSGKSECVNCGATHTPLWRRGLNDELNCNACGLYCKLHKRPRPKTMRQQHHHSNSAGGLTHATRNPSTAPVGAGSFNANTGASRSYNHGTNASASGNTNANSSTNASASAGVYDPSQSSASTSGNGSRDVGEPARCVNCHTMATPLWRKDDEGKTVCNACGLYFKLHNANRPISMKSDVIRKRARNEQHRRTSFSGMSPTPSASPGASRRSSPERGTTPVSDEQPQNLAQAVTAAHQRQQSSVPSGPDPFDPAQSAFNFPADEFEFPNNSPQVTHSEMPGMGDVMGTYYGPPNFNQVSSWFAYSEYDPNGPVFPGPFHPEYLRALGVNVGATSQHGHAPAHAHTRSSSNVGDAAATVASTVSGSAHAHAHSGESSDIVGARDATQRTETNAQSASGGNDRAHKRRRLSTDSYQSSIASATEPPSSAASSFFPLDNSSTASFSSYSFSVKGNHRRGDSSAQHSEYTSGNASAVEDEDENDDDFAMSFLHNQGPMLPRDRENELMNAFVHADPGNPMSGSASGTLGHPPMLPFSNVNDFNDNTNNEFMDVTMEMFNTHF